MKGNEMVIHFFIGHHWEQHRFFEKITPNFTSLGGGKIECQFANH